jgi:glycosyltransferase involved in cell wall biosynthesis
MIYADLASGEHGCGIAGDNLVNALSALTPVRRISLGMPVREPLDGPLLERLRRTFRPTFAATRNIAYTVFEDDLRWRRTAGRMRGLFDALAPASRWCEEVLRAAGLTGVTTIHQGIDPIRFNPSRAVRTVSRDRFVIFSGGKFEFRKGQDIAVKAFRAFAARHADVHLIAHWHNPWKKFANTMTMSRHVPFRCRDGASLDTLLREWLIDAGVDLRRVTLLPQTPNAGMAAIYGNTDVGLFPNRCEGSTNLVMMEYMACGRTPIASDFSGHRDVLTDERSIRLRSLRPLRMVEDGTPIGWWCEPDVEEVIESLEDVYRHRDKLTALGARAAADLAEWTWDRAARKFLDLLQVERTSSTFTSANAL